MVLIPQNILMIKWSVRRRKINQKEDLTNIKHSWLTCLDPSAQKIFHDSITFSGKCLQVCCRIYDIVYLSYYRNTFNNKQFEVGIYKSEIVFASDNPILGSVYQKVSRDILDGCFWVATIFSWIENNCDVLVGVGWQFSRRKVSPLLFKEWITFQVIIVGGGVYCFKFWHVSTLR